MVITGLTMYLVYGRAGWNSGNTEKSVPDTEGTAPVLAEAARSDPAPVP